MLNGQKIGDQVLAPAQTNYDRRKLQKLIYYHEDQSRQRVLYNTFDVTKQLKQGGNVIGIVLGNGWYNQRDRSVEGCMWYNTPRLLFQMELIYSDGHKQLVCSDKTWKMTTGPIRHDGIFTGELYDARLELGEWCRAAYDDQNWQMAKEVNAPTGKLQAQLAPPDRITRTIHPTYLNTNASGACLFDAGEMISGWVQIKMHGQSGDTVRIRHIEELGGDYHQMDNYILKGSGEEIYEPRFTWHAFRQVEISGLKYRPKEEELLVKVVHTDVVPVGNFECSNPLFNQIYQNYLRTQLGTFTVVSAVIVRTGNDWDIPEMARWLLRRPYAILTLPAFTRNGFSTWRMPVTTGLVMCRTRCLSVEEGVVLHGVQPMLSCHGPISGIMATKMFLKPIMMG